MAKLAINGGEKVITRSMGKQWPIWDKREEKALLDVLHSRRWWGGGEGSKVREFEDAFAKYHDAKYAVTTNSGIQSLICALKAAGVESCDEVLVPSLTFFASVTCVLFVMLFRFSLMSIQRHTIPVLKRWKLPLPTGRAPL